MSRRAIEPERVAEDIMKILGTATADTVVVRHENGSVIIEGYSHVTRELNGYKVVWRRAEDAVIYLDAETDMVKVYEILRAKVAPRGYTVIYDALSNSVHVTRLREAKLVSGT